MRKILAMIFILMMVLSAFCGCGRNKQVVETSNGEKIVVESTGKKIDGEIIAASSFSEGLAFVELSGEKGKTYCINKKGEIVFKLDIDLSVNGNIYATFTNGLAYVNEGFCDTTGKVTKPADVGATSFGYAATLSEGYVLAEVVTSDYSNTNKKLGVLNTKFEWTVEPSENLYNEFANEYGSSTIETSRFTEDYTVGDWYYNVGLQKALNLKTGEVTKEKEKIGIPNSSVWSRTLNRYYLPGESTEDGLMIDLTKTC